MRPMLHVRHVPPDLSHATVYFFGQAQSDITFVKPRALLSSLRLNTSFGKRNMEPNNYCQVCQQPSFMQCARCHAVWYCSTACQSAAWPTHYTSCIPPVEELSPTPPAEGTTYAQVLVLPVNSSRHFITRIMLEARVGPTGAVRWTPNFGSEINLGTSPASVVNLEGFGGNVHRFPFHIFFRRSFMNDGSQINECINSLTQGRAAHPWAGDVVVLKFHGSRREKYRDFELTDLAAIAHFFMHYPNIS